MPLHEPGTVGPPLTDTWQVVVSPPGFTVAVTVRLVPLALIVTPLTLGGPGVAICTGVSAVPEIWDVSITVTAAVYGVLGDKPVTSTFVAAPPAAAGVVKGVPPGLTVTW